MPLKDVYERNFDEDVPAAGQSSRGCPECGGLVHTNSIETTCEDCGLVLEDRPIDHGSEWRALDGGERTERKRTGPPLTPARHDRGLSSEIGFDRTDANGIALSGRKTGQLARLRRENRRGRWASKAEKNLAHGLSDVRRMSGALNLARSLRDQACQIFRIAAEQGLMRGRSIEAMTAASVYAACRCAGLPRPLEEITAVAAVPHDRVQNAYTVLNRELRLPAMTVGPAGYIPRLASELDISPATRRRAADLARVMIAAGAISGCKPAGIAAACLYQAGLEQGERVTQRVLADAAGITPVTLRTRWKHLQALLID
ncbi:transcription initiation factor IIB [Haloplanus rubicundus]|uniref:Transcription initiation factor IIB n=1 Tax=Haloplanus rubicundus TaxID=1547898 RepID=A0A345EC23_9EURY|nr:TFIIB-type zinc ribbon-containing protein [Haloplanus rubicundus]AXG09745.1 transcription initiation factor IIB family protein [Haloplanus rubicundus]